MLLIEDTVASVRNNIAETLREYNHGQPLPDTVSALDNTLYRKAGWTDYSAAVAAHEDTARELIADAEPPEYTHAKSVLLADWPLTWQRIRLLLLLAY